jgi:hypothetical protein
MPGVAGAVIGLAAGQQTTIAPAQTLTDSSTSGRGCTTNFIGFGFGLTDVGIDPPQDFSATDDTVVRALAAGGTVQTPTYNAIAGSVPPQSTFSWAVGSAAAAPVNTVAPTITGTAQVGSTLTAGNGTWTGTPTPTYTYEWLAGAVVTAGVAVGGVVLNSVTNTYVPNAADVGKTITCKVTGRNPAGTVTVATVVTAAVIA